MKRNFLIYLALVFLCAMLNLGFASGTLSGDLDAKLAELARQIESNMAEGKKAKIAVIEFSDLNGNITDFGKFLSEELITRLFMTKRFEVIERQLLSKVIAEHKLTLSGFVDPNAAKELGKLLGVDAIATGTITDLDATVKINARLIATDTGSIFAVASVEMTKDETIKRLLGKTSQDNKPHQSPQSSTSKPGEIFFQEDFSSYEPGDIAESWGNDIVVGGSGASKYVTSHTTTDHEMMQYVNFPSDFAFEFLVAGILYGNPILDLALIGDSPVNIRFGNWSQILINNATVGINRECWPREKWNKIRIVKKGISLKVFVNDCLGPSISVATGTNFSKFRLFWRYRQSSSENFSFTKFVGTKL
ncbi:MAG: CsgG/HfaB family protein [candidate division KSB1 bacterium]|nr:CsgG/HfaB family protein [candidate division KSB1 bacterium]